MKQPVLYESNRDLSEHFCVFEAKDSYTLPHFHRSIEMLYITAGALEGEVGEEKIRVTADDIVFVNNFCVHAFRPVPEYEKYVFIVSARYADDFENLFTTHALPAVLADKEFNRTLRPILKSMLLENEEMPPLVVKGYVNVILGRLLAHYGSIPSPRDAHMGQIADILSYIDRHYAEPITLTSLAEKFGYNKYYFSRMFNSRIGDSLSGYVNNVRLQHVLSEAKKDERRSIATLAYDSGFDSLTTFYRTFSRVYPGTPKSVLRGE